MAIQGVGTSFSTYFSAPFTTTDSVKPTTVLAWCRAPALPSANGGTQPFLLWDAGNSYSNLSYNSTGTIDIDENDSANVGTVFTSGTISNLADNGWHLLEMQLNSQTSRAAYFDGAQVISDNATAIGSQGFAFLAVGCVPATYSVAEVVWLKGAIGAAEREALLAGENVLSTDIRSRLIRYFPLRSSLADLGPSRASLVSVGGAVAAYTDHPPVAAARGRVLLYKAAVAATFAASPTGSSGASAALSTDISLSSSVAASSSAIANLATAIPLTIAGNATTSAAPTMATSITLGASPSDASSASAALSTAILLAAAPAGASSASPTLSTAILLAASPIASTRGNGDLISAVVPNPRRSLAAPGAPRAAAQAGGRVTMLPGAPRSSRQPGGRTAQITGGRGVTG